MKELSIEEKAKRYDEAIEMAKKVLLDCTPEEQNVVEYIYPELKESEDERIVKELLTFFRESIHGGHILTNKEYDSWIAWLEKQGEQILANSAKTCKDGQKPAWSKKDEEYFDDIARTLRSFVITGGSEAKRYTEEEINWLESLKDRVQPKQEWGEEDETRLTNTIIMLKEGASLHFNKKDITKAVDWLKSLRPQNRWAGVTKEQIDTIAQHLENIGNSAMAEILYKIHSQSEWKPSDEQINCLSDEIKHINSLGYPAFKLKELLDDLKKLREG